MPQRVKAHHRPALLEACDRAVSTTAPEGQTSGMPRVGTCPVHPPILSRASEMGCGVMAKPRSVMILHAGLYEVFNKQPQQPTRGKYYHWGLPTKATTLVSQCQSSCLTRTFISPSLQIFPRVSLALLRSLRLHVSVPQHTIGIQRHPLPNPPSRGTDRRNNLALVARPPCAWCTKRPPPLPQGCSRGEEAFAFSSPGR